MAAVKYYVVWVGHKPGIYRSWADCQAQTKGFPQARFKSYESEAEARQALEKGWQKSLNFGGKPGASSSSASGNKSATPETAPEVDYDSLSVDVGCSGNPGIVEYKGVDTRTGEILFYQGPISKGTNNLGEFLAIVHGLAYLQKQGSNKTIYTDSVTALSWIRKKEVSTNLVRDASTEEIWSLVDRALKWLRTNSYANKIVKWDTKKWGEIKADFGRK
ncbi:viroplasmin family protein [Paenibacillus sp. CGMCC 1.16610]|uniref:Ribonuclease H n=1 Tax=Paenibacillus anseongense TaxID=2682845 RepID=A0ABW9UAG0_9BACL|nr:MULTISPECIES: ribonuclease H family protein [Paenibacillus]MBA2940566.1 viroplasmin family protein [Paenibacillus sp. CGMCC 1.16610]MVQ35743.1 ribonuclease H [Paenibacillus anseongense]